MINVSVSGNLGQDAELKSLADGNSVLSFSIASNAKVKGVDKTTWVRCSIWGARGVALHAYLVKGVKVVCVGSLDVREYQANDGTAKTSLDLRVDQLDFMSSGTAAAHDAEESGEISNEEFPHGANAPRTTPTPSKIPAKKSPMAAKQNGSRSAHR